MTDAAINQALITLTSALNLCPARIWSITRSTPGQQRNLPGLIPATINLNSIVKHTGHQRCSFDYCEASNLNFTSVQQRHESSLCTDQSCDPLTCFPQQAVVSAVNKGEHAVWELSGECTLSFPEPYMAVSHVWADGTGTGPIPQRGVNRCLYDFLCSLARRFNCRGIWWDTISIPDDKAARMRALSRMHEVYEDARFTFVHDSYLRQWCWSDAEAACFAIVMSPWFSRGWTALELACSRRVRIMFANDVIKDLDTDILGQGKRGIAHSIITSLRGRGHFTLDELLGVIGSRYTSWPRDRATIAALLTGTPLGDDMSHQETYQEVLKNIGEVFQGHLFHNLPTMAAGFSWCPARVEDIPPSPSSFTLKVAPDGSVIGRWKKLDHSDCFHDRKYNWMGIHPLIAVQLRAALAEGRRDPHGHMMLAEPFDGKTARVVIVEKQSELNRFVGTLYLLEPAYTSGATDVITIGGTGQLPETTSAMPRMPRTIESYESQLLSAVMNGDEVRVQELIDDHHQDINFRDRHSWTALHYASWREHVGVAEILLQNGADGNLTDRFGQRALHVAAERGNESLVQMLLSGDLRSRCNDGQTILHRAAAGGSLSVVSLILDKCDTAARDSEERTAIQISTAMGYPAVGRMIFKKSGLMKTDPFGLTSNLNLPWGDAKPLHWATGLGNIPEIKILLENGEDVNCIDQDYQTPLMYAARRGDMDAVKLLLQHRADLRFPDRYFRQAPLSQAAEFGHEDIVQVFLEHGASTNDVDKYGRTALFYAAMRGHRGVVAALLVQNAVVVDWPDNVYGQTPLSRAAEGGHMAVVQLLASSGANPDATDKSGRTPLCYASENSHFPLSSWLKQHVRMSCSGEQLK